MESEKSNFSSKRRIARSTRISTKQLKTTKTAHNEEFASSTDCVQVHNFGTASRVCQVCKAVRFEADLESICCGRGNMSLPGREKQPEVILKPYQNKFFLALDSLRCHEPKMEYQVAGQTSEFKAKRTQNRDPTSRQKGRKICRIWTKMLSASR